MGKPRNLHPRPAADAMPEEAEVAIASLDPEGRGVGDHPALPGRTLAVAGALPGDRVRVALNLQGHARLLDVLEASPARIASDCRFHGPCGGCDLIAFAYPACAQAKAGLVAATVAAVPGGCDELLPFRAAPATTGYRHRARLHQSRSHGRPDAGYLPARGRGIVSVDRCLLLVPALQSRLIALREGIANLPFRVEEVRVAAATEGKEKVAAHVELARGVSANRAKSALTRLLEPCRLIGLTAGPAGRGVELALGNPRLGGAVAPGLPNGPYQFEPCHFTQGNAAMNVELVAAVRDFAAIAADERVVELYAGCGNLTLPLAHAGARVFAIEGDPGAVRMAHKNVARANVKERVRLAEGPATELWRHAEREPAVLLLDPPREGCGAVGRIVRDLLPTRVVHVACDLRSFARDAASLTNEGYRLRRAVGLDLYPRTHHIELVALFTR